MQESLQRLKSHRDFVTVLKTRTKASSKDLVVHFHIRPETNRQIGHSEAARSSTQFVIDKQTMAERARLEALGPDDRRLGLAVSKAVGNAVTRNRVKRRLRVLARQYVSLLPQSCDVVVRAKPSADTASFDQLQVQVQQTFNAIAKKVAARSAHSLHPNEHHGKVQ